MPTLEWIGKDKVINHHQEVPFKVLNYKYSYNKDGMVNDEKLSENKIIRGDNLEALKALLPEYEGKIKCIYIDPPYNTGNEKWVYNDNVNHPRINKWLGDTVGKEGEDLSRHDKWLCMMYPRLKLLEKLLADDGIIFISIDDNEQASLRMICDEIFGRKNFLAQFTWKTDGNFDNQAKVKICHEYILAYFKEPSLMGVPKGVDPSVPKSSKVYKNYIRNTVVKNGPKNPMSEIKLPIGFPCTVEKIQFKQREDAYPYYINDAYIDNYKLKNEVIVKSGWQSKDILQKYIDNNCEDVLDSKGQLTRFELTKTGAIEQVKKRNDPSHVISVLSGLGSTQNMSNELKKANIEFTFPKPTSLLEYIINFYTDEESIILDSFAGSGTTAHAVLNMNKIDNGKRKFILIEMEDYAERITAERVKNVINGYADIEGIGGDFNFYDLGEKLLLDDGNINKNIEEDKIRKYIFYMETKQALQENKNYDNQYYLGKYGDTAYYFFYEKDSSTTLNHKFLSTIKTKSENYIIYADKNTLSELEIARYNITFKKLPRDIIYI
ncbi:site-specific DNA-methyltransferase [Clostridium botulinum]|uniref:site-specific DNA-methyltransferase n=1 Tax=Clostridium botulinum TaxID=1491 RepID=UPI0019672F0B|nr:site-specific DNA-methyltransferase [Clostridium botulinum]MBN1064501.1 site-specific DNA-methyltransferase [Clostridium botulinum]